jgi:hypothetical protein
VSELLSKVVKVRFTGSTYSAMALRAAAEKRTISDWIRVVVEGAIGGPSVSRPDQPSPEPSVVIETGTTVAVATEPEATISMTEGDDPEPESIHVVVPEPVTTSDDFDLQALLDEEFK